ncbi:hypothetical protein DFH07DRAFT_17623 [Mycena maculata]|uniref:F-box domain-containing protein n=1 Tax=Mycena maculata TaxID=230809 RepID=A0AAD7IMY8_9AGAR|nr:hypothetical protein DFH07DRAFT_17623 [Mycena maculata]
MDTKLPEPHVRRGRVLGLDKEIASPLQRSQSRGGPSALSFPVLTLPTEITTEIFTCCLPKTPRDPRSCDAPLLLTRICQQWRDIALSTPRLWTTVSFPADKPRPSRRLAIICWTFGSPDSAVWTFHPHPSFS